MLTLLATPIYASINIRTIKSLFIFTFVSIKFLTKNLSAKTEAVKHLHAVSLLTAEQRRRPIRWQRAMIYFDVTDGAWLDIIIGNVNYITFQLFMIGSFQ